MKWRYCNNGGMVMLALKIMVGSTWIIMVAPSSPFMLAPTPLMHTAMQHKTTHSQALALLMHVWSGVSPFLSCRLGSSPRLPTMIAIATWMPATYLGAWEMSASE